MINLERTPQVAPVIPPLPEGTVRPMWSVMIPAYNCSAYLPHTIQSILIQDRGEANMQIEVVDDCSTDADVEALVKNVGKGRVSYFRQPKNVGSLRNFETCLNRAKGHYVHLFHGDDMVIEGFYEEITSLFEDCPEAGAAFTNFHYMDGKGEKIYDNEIQQMPRGIVKNFLQKIGAHQMLQTVAIVVKRSTYEKIGSFYGVHYGEDWEMWARIAANFPVAFSPLVLAKYRVHDENISFNSFGNSQNIKDLTHVISTIESYLPKEEAKKITKIARRNASKHYAWVAHRVYHHSYDREQALAQSKAALKLDINSVSITQALKLYFKLLIGYKK